MEKLAPKLVFIVGLAILILFTVYGFFVHQPCDVDRIYLSCRLHPFTFGDLIGCILFYSSCLWLIGVTRLFGFDIYQKPHSSALNLYGFLGAVIGIILVWNL